MGLVEMVFILILLVGVATLGALYWLETGKTMSNPNNNSGVNVDQTSNTVTSATIPCDGDSYADIVLDEFAKMPGMRCQDSLPKAGGEIGQSIASTKEGCAAMCDLDPSCTSWQWNIGAQNCALSNECGRYDTIQDTGHDLYLKRSAIDDEDLFRPEGYSGAGMWNKLRRRIARYIV